MITLTVTEHEQTLICNALYAYREDALRFAGSACGCGLVGRSWRQTAREVFQLRAKVSA